MILNYLLNDIQISLRFIEISNSFKVDNTK